MSLLSPSKVYTPSYPEIVEITQLHERIHWGEWEVKLQQDVEDWKLGRITEDEKQFISSVLRLFTQSDVAVGSDYYDNLIPVFRNNEARNMLGSFAGREGTHQRAYALLNDTLGFGSEFYEEFMSFKEMKDKMEFMLDMKNSNPEEIAMAIAKQCLIEGVSLFASFAMLLNFTKYGVMLGMGDVVQWSIKDESVHVHGNSVLFRKFIEEFPQVVTNPFKREIYETAREVVKLEDEFINLVFAKGNPRGMHKEEMHQYIRNVVDYRMNQLGFKTQYDVKNPFDWLDWITSSTMVENFFETNTAAYSKGSMKGSYEGGY